MPWVKKRMKDAFGCDKFWRGAKDRLEPEISEWGNLSTISRSKIPRPCELKYLSNRRKRNRKRFP